MTLRRRFARLSAREASLAGSLPSSSGTAPSGSIREKRTPWAPAATPVTATATTAASLAVASRRWSLAALARVAHLVKGRGIPTRANRLPPRIAARPISWAARAGLVGFV